MIDSDKDYKLAVLALARMTFLTLQEKFILLKKLDSLYNLVVLSIEDISKIIGRKSKAFWNGQSALQDAKHDLNIITKFNISTVLYTDEDYPVLLKEISDPPFLLFYRGDIQFLKNKSVSVVGTRKIIKESASECFDFAKSACLDGVNVISGLAFGIDRKAHEGALEAYYEAEGRFSVGKTAAVLPGGIDIIVPRSLTMLAAKILEAGGCILSEYPPGFEPKPYCFVQRNRIIAGLSCATVVIQAPPGSGAMLTAGFAVDYNREVVFHSVAFSENCKKISELVKVQLLNNAQTGRSAANKLKNDPELYVQDGAPVVNDYAEYCRFMNEHPGVKIYNETNCAQLNLF